jgi:hypoxanthine phosphoribosyltransferase
VSTEVRPATEATAPTPRLRVLWSSDEVRAGIDALAARIAEAFRDAPVVNLVPVLTGGLHTAAALSAALERVAPGKWLIAPIFASTYVGDGVLEAPAIDFPERFDRAIDPSGPVVIVDDLLDTGTTMSALVRMLTARGLGPVRVCVLIDKPQRRAVPLEPDFFAFRTVDDCWLVGFGMDSGRRFRGLDAICALEEPEAV